MTSRSPRTSRSSRPALTVRRALFERLSRPLLARFLATHAAPFCAAHGLPTRELGESDPRDRRLVHHLCALLRTPDLDPPLPDAAAGWLAVLDAIATPGGGERLTALDTSGVLPKAKLGDEDLGLTAVLDQPALARMAASLTPSEAADAQQSFTEYDPRPLDPASLPRPELRFDDARRKTMEALLADELDARGRSRYCEIHARREASRLVFEIDYCRRPKTRDRLDLEALVIAPATDVNGERAFAEIELSTGRLAVHAPHAAIKELIRKAFGQVLAGSREHFTAARVYDLSPFADLDLALSARGVDRRLLGVALHQLTIQTPAGSEVDFARPRKELRSDAVVEGLLRQATSIGIPVAVRLYLNVLDRRPLKVELSAKQGRNRLQFKREDPELVAIVRSYLLARGVLRELGEAGTPGERDARDTEEANADPTLFLALT